MRNLAVVLCAPFALLAACTTASEPEMEVKRGEEVVVTDIVNGDIECVSGTVGLTASGLVNGDIVGTRCNIKLDGGTVNGSVIAMGGGILSISNLHPNGGVEADDVAQVSIVDSDFNGGALITDSGEVAVERTGFNGTVIIQDNSQLLFVDNYANGDIELAGNDECVEGGNGANGDIVAGGCVAR